MNDVYKKKVELLLRILPFVTDEECFAIHGGYRNKSVREKS